MTQPVPRGLPVGGFLLPSWWASRVAAGLHRQHVLTTTPANSRGAFFARFPRDGSLPRISTGSAFASPFSRLARCSLILGPVRSLTRYSSLWHRELRLPPLPATSVPTASGGAKAAGWDSLSHGSPAPFPRRTEIFGL